MRKSCVNVEILEKQYKNTREDSDLISIDKSRVDRHPKDFLLLYVDGGFDLRTHVGDVDALNNDCGGEK